MATLNALVEDLPKKGTEGHHDGFARVEIDCWVILWIQPVTVHH